ncbi:hypothetical protein S40293_05201 [Stachybotrys chartarum IBT 40293]|nr:hypothetical protein S40293_05201 [Stachybotrys chartarum IBT 40293]
MQSFIGLQGSRFGWHSTIWQSCGHVPIPDDREGAATQGTIPPVSIYPRSRTTQSDASDCPFILPNISSPSPQSPKKPLCPRLDPAGRALSSCLATTGCVNLSIICVAPWETRDFRSPPLQQPHLPACSPYPHPANAVLAESARIHLNGDIRSHSRSPWYWIFFTLSAKAKPLSNHGANHLKDRQPHRRRPFSNWVKKLTTFKSSSDGDRPKRHRKAKSGPRTNNPYLQSAYISNGGPSGESACSFTTGQSGSNTSLDQPGRRSADGQTPPTTGARSFAGTDNEGAHSIVAPSHGASSLAGTSRTAGGGIDSRRGGDSTFSSPAPSVRSLTTTLTTIQSLAPNGNGSAAPSHSTHLAQNAVHSIQFSQPFPTTSPASAIPPHLAPTGNPTNYVTATANNLWTDNASILTLASSSKQRRRRSMDTDASVRALAPSSLWGGSRESLPLSVLSSNIEASGMPATPGIHGNGPRLGAERTSIYSATGVAPALASERNSYYAGKGDGASVRSGLLGHGRTDSVGGNTAITTSHLTSTRELSDDGMERAEKEDYLSPGAREQ